MSEFCGFEVSNSKEFGRCIIAKRNYRVGELILVEEPLLTAQFGKQEDGSGVNKKKFDCISCFKTLTSEYNEVCPNCLWPVCSKNCVVDSLHSKYECSLFKEKKIGQSFKVYSYMYLIRGVLIYQDKANPIKWERLASLSSSYSMNQDCYLKNRAENVQRAQHFFKQCFQMDVDAKILDHIIGACNVNGFDMSSKDEPGNSYRAQALFYLGSMFAHSCAPNAVWVVFPYDYNGIKSGHLRIYTRRNILCNDYINVSYIGAGFSLDAAERNYNLKKNYRFDCKCSRCLDPSEFSFYTEAIFCPSCGDETLTADSPSNVFSKWTCNKCGVQQPYFFSKWSVNNFDSSLIWRSLSLPPQDTSLTPSEEYCGLHPNHRKVIHATFNCLELRCRQRFQQLTQNAIGCDEMFVTFMNTTIKCLKVLSMFGSMSDMVVLEYWIARIIAAYYFKTVDFLSTPYDPYLPHEKLTILTSIIAHLKIACDTLEWFPFDYMELRFKQDLTDGYKFWNDELNDQKDISSEASDEKNEDGVKVETQVSELRLTSNDCSERPNKNSDETSYSESKTFPTEFCDPVNKELHEESVEIKKGGTGQSSNLLPCDVTTSPGDSNSVLMKPPVSLLAKVDFYFDA